MSTTRAALRPRTLALPLLGVLALTACEEDMGQDAWIEVENRSGEAVYIDYADSATDSDVIGWVGARGTGRVSVDACGLKALDARLGAPDGPVVATRSEDAARDCVSLWVIDP